MFRSGSCLKLSPFLRPYVYASHFALMYYLSAFTTPVQYLPFPRYTQEFSMFAPSSVTGRTLFVLVELVGILFSRLSRGSEASRVTIHPANHTAQKIFSTQILPDVSNGHSPSSSVGQLAALLF